ncbi:hypothetical protein ACFX2A_041277 [Malus domestica]
MLHKSNVVFPKTSSPVMCQSCLEDKFCKLPFSPSVNKSVIPFEVVHSDLWGPAPCVSVDGYSEHDFPYKDLLAHTNSKSSCSLPFDTPLSPPIVTPQNVVTIMPLDPHTSPSLSNSPSPPPSPTTQQPSQSITGAVFDNNSPVVLDHSPDILQVVTSIPPLNLHPMQTRSKNGISMKKVFLSTLAASKDVDLSFCEPLTYKSALKSSVWF